jgi:activator of HSP90 ATPase
MRVFKISIGEYIYGIYAKDSVEAISFLHEEIGYLKVDKIQEIPESEWDKKDIKIYEDNDTSTEPFFVSIREEICGNEAQLIFTNDFSTFS